VATPDPAVAPLVAATFAYWRSDAQSWPARCAALRALGIGAIDCDVPWRVHEPTRGSFDWSGARDVARVVRCARDAGLEVILRVGPACDVELPCFGLPDHVVADPACQARGAHGTPLWIASPPRAWPMPVYTSAALGVRVRAWIDALESVLRNDASEISALGVDRGTHGFFRNAESAGARSAAATCVDDALDASSLAAIPRFATMLDEPVAVPRARLREVRRRSYAAEAVPRIGNPPWYAPTDDGDADRLRDQLLSVLAGGAQRCAIALPDDVRAASWLAPITRAFAKRRPMVPHIAVLAPVERGPAAPFDPVPTWMLRALGLVTPSLDERWEQVVLDALELAGVPYVGCADTAIPESARVVIAPSATPPAAERWHQLSELARSKTMRVVVGPVLGEPSIARAGRLRRESIDDVAGLAADLAQLDGRPPLWQLAGPPRPGVAIVSHGDQLAFAINDRSEPVEIEIAAPSPRALSLPAWSIALVS
jgi:hypothetical protein